MDYPKFNVSKARKKNPLVHKVFKVNITCLQGKYQVVSLAIIAFIEIFVEFLQVLSPNIFEGKKYTGQPWDFFCNFGKGP